MRARQKIQELAEERAKLIAKVTAKEQLSQEEQERLQQVEKEIADLTVYMMME